MLHYTKHIFFLLCCLIFTTPAAAKTEIGNNSDYILFINSYLESSPWSNAIITQVTENLAQRHESVGVYTEQMNALLSETQKDVLEFSDKVFKKHDRQAPKAIIILGIPGWVVLHEQLEAQWADVPVILCSEFDFIGKYDNYMGRIAVDEAKRIPMTEIIKKHNLSVVYYPFYVKETVDLMKRTMPQMKRLLFISDKRYISKENRQELQRVVETYYPDMELVFLNQEDYDTETLLKRLWDTSSSDGILFSSWYRPGILSKNKVLLTDDYKTISQNTSAPIFILNDIGVSNSKMAGGYFIPEKYWGNEVSNLVDDILSGKKIKTKSLLLAGDAVPVLNYEVLKERGISLALSPENAVFYHKPETIWEKYKYYILIGVLVVGLLWTTMLMRIKMLNNARHMQEKEIKLITDYSNLFNNMPVAYIREKLIFDEAGKPVDFVVTRVNPSAEKYFKKDKVALNKRGSEFSNSNLAILLQVYTSILQGDKKVATQYYYYEEDDTTYSVIIFAHGKDEIDIFCIDTTELSEVQKQLNTVNHKLAMAVEVANIIPWKLDLQQQTVVCDIHNYPELTPEENEQKNLPVPTSAYFAKIYRDDREKVKAAYEALAGGREPKVKEIYRVYNMSRKNFDWVEVRAVVDKFDKDGKPLSLIGSSMVINERKETEKELILAKEKAEESNRLKSAFLANMSHEIRTPLNAIVGFSSIIASTEDEKEKHDYLTIIENNNDLLLQLISDILDLSKIEAGTLEFVYSDIDLNNLLEELEQLFAMKIKSDQVKMIFEDHLPECRINTERNRLVQVVSNLLNNALKFTNQGDIRFGYQLQGEYLRFYVTDTGCGISEADRKNIFGRFVKLNSFAQGTGLGLAISQTIVRNLGGEIGVDSEEGKGSTFWFTIPYRPIGEIVEHRQETCKSLESDDDKQTVLIAEDNPSNFKLFESILKRQYNIIHAWNGKEAVELFRKHKPKIILMDINMPVMDGYQATAEIRNICSCVPIIAVTAYAYATDESKIMASGFNAYVPKPVNAYELKSQINDLLS